MKTIKSTFLTALGISLMLLTGCTVTQSLPYDDVYNSGSTPVPQQQIATTSYASTRNNVYKEGNVQVVTVIKSDTVPQADTASQREVILIRKDTILSNNDNYNNLDFDNPYFGSGVNSWTMGNFNWYAGSYWGGNYPYYSSYYWGYPYSGWSNWYWGYPYYSWNYPYYSWYSPYYWNYPYYNSWNYPYYYSTPAYTNVRYGHRGSLFSGGNVHRTYSMWSSGYPSTKSARLNRPNTYRGAQTVKTKEGNLGVTNSRPAGSIRYQKALTEKQRLQKEKRTQFQKPATNYRGGTSVTRRPYNKGQQVRQENIAKPRYQKPRQYQSLDNRNTKSSKVYYRTQPNNFVRNTKPGTVVNNNKSRKFNVYRPNNTQRVNQRPVYRNTKTRTTRFQTPNYRPTNNNFRNTRTRTFTPSRSFTPSRRTITPSRSSSPTIRTGGGSGGSRSSGGGTRSTGSGGIRR